MSRLFALVYDPFMRRTEEACLAGWRKELLSELEGDVLEIGAGTGANLAFYGPSVRRLVLAEPDAFMRRRLEEKAPRVRGGVEIVSAEAESLPFDSGTFDVVASTLVLCTVRDPDAALCEARRVLRPSGRLVFLEHVVAEEPGRRAWQGRIDPIWKHLAGGCRLVRDTASAVRRAGFEILREERASMRKAPPWVRPTIRGVAVRT